MAHTLLEHKGLTDHRYITRLYTDEFQSCVTFLKAHKLQDALLQNENNVTYACGDIMSLITAGALKRQNPFTFWNALLADHTAKNSFNSTDYFTMMTKLGASAEIVAGLKQIAHEQVNDPSTLLRSLMQSSGLAPKFDESGNLTDLKLP